MADTNKTFAECWYADVPQADGSTARSCWIAQADAQAFHAQNPNVPVTAAIGMADNGPYNGYINSLQLLQGIETPITGTQLYMPDQSDQ